MDAPEIQWVWLARVRRPQGRKGEVFAEVLTDFPEKFTERRRLWLVPDAEGSGSGSSGLSSQGSAVKQSSQASNSPRQVELIHHWLHKGGVVLHFDGVQSISDAEALTGLVVAVPQEERAALGEDEVYISDLVGCQVVDVIQPDQPRVIGVVRDVERDAGPVSLLVVDAGRRDVLIPFAKAFLKSVDPAAKRIEMELPEGLVDLNS